MRNTGGRSCLSAPTQGGIVKPVTTLTRTALLGVLIATAGCPAPFPETAIRNDRLQARVYLPDGQSGFYRGTRFDWSGVMVGLEYAGHEYFPQWFQRTGADVHDFIYDGPDIVAGPCTAVTGPAEEFVASPTAMGFDRARPGEGFLKIGVGVLRKPDDARYDPYRLYPILNGGRWHATARADSVIFDQSLNDPGSGYGYEYQKAVSLPQGDASRLVLQHRLRNTGSRPLEANVYNHNFLYLDRRPPGPDTSITFPFPVRSARPLTGGLAKLLAPNQLGFVRTFSGEDQVYLELQGYGTDAKDYDIRIENRAVGAGVRITGDRPLARLALWAIRAPLSVEPFIALEIPPGAEFTWRLQYEFYTVPTVP